MSLGCPEQGHQVASTPPRGTNAATEAPSGPAVDNSTARGRHPGHDVAMHPIIRAALDAGRGTATGSDLLRRGASRRDVERAVGAGDLVRVRRNALVDGERWRETKPWHRHDLRARAVARALGNEPPLVLTHHSALAVRGIEVHGVDDRVHVARIGSGRGRTDTGLASHRPLDASLTATHQGLLTVTPAVACVQVASHFGGEAGLVSADHALHQEEMTRADLDGAMAALEPWRWSREPAKMLALADGSAESGAESRTRWALRTLGLRLPTPQVEIFDSRGDFVARVDFLYEDMKLVIEVDGRKKYEKAQDVWDEKLREDRLRALGYVIVRLTWADLDDLAVVRGKVLRGVALAA